MAGDSWSTKTFGECAILIRDTVHPEYAQGLPYIGLEHITERQLTLNSYGFAEDVTSIKSRFRKGDILFGKLRPYFRKVILAPFDGVCSTDIWVVRANSGIHQRFLFYWMASQDFIEEATRTSEGTKMPRAQWEYVERLERFIPPFPEQCAIAHILGTLDDKIELNRRMNETLEAMARVLFKSWFIDFDPVRAKMEGRNPDLPKEIADLFPDSFQESELGRVPKGWRVGTIGGEFNLTMGQSPPGKTYNEIGEGISFYQGRADFCFRYPNRRVFCTSPTRFANHGDTLVSVRAPVGDINLAMEKCCIGRGVAAIRHKSNSRSYTYNAMHSLSNVFRDFEAEGTVFGCINKYDFHSIKYIAPPPQLVDKFEATAFPIDQSIENNILQSASLATIREALLPKLLSGEIHIKAAEKLVGSIQ